MRIIRAKRAGRFLRQLIVAALFMGAAVPVAYSQDAARPAAQTASPPAAQPAASEQAQPEAPSVSAPAILPRDLSPWSMFLNADFIVKLVIVGLALASFITWTVWLAKGIELLAAKHRAADALRGIRDAGDLDEAADRSRRGPVGKLLAAAVAEVDRSAGMSAEGIKERVSVSLSRIEARAGRGMARGTGILATIGATAPFVGLFGTVWGIMNSFVSISQSHTTNLAVVAPGIAEALLATAIGLVAAIPAVIIYNHFARVTKSYLELVNRASGAAARLLSRDLDRTHGAPLSRAAE